MLLVCPGNTNGFNNTNFGIKTTAATCDSGITSYVNSVSYNFPNFACKGYSFHIPRGSGSTCYDGTKRDIEIGFEVDSDFYKLIDIYFDDVLYTTLYAKANIVSGVAGFRNGFPRPSFIQDSFCPGISVENLYTRKTQRQTISTILGSMLLGDHYIDGTILCLLFSGERPPFSQS
jgi:hypothetical protein